MSRTNLKFFLAIFAFVAFQAFAQKPDEVLMKVGDQKVSVGEFKFVYEKNNENNEDLYTKADVKDYLDMYINFKLKVQDAKRLGLDTVGTFQREYKSYKDQVSMPYLSDKDAIENLFEEAYERYGYEVNASHILLTLPDMATEQDSQNVYNKLQEIRKDIKSERDFFSNAVAYSEDPSVRRNKGNLGYFTVFSMVYPFENVAYNLEPGEVSEPFLTEYGYHIMYLHDKRPARGEMEVNHLMIRKQANDDKSEVQQKEALMDSIHSRIEQGVPFVDMVEKYSQDENTKKDEGRFPKFKSTATYLPESFKDQAFALENKGDISPVFETQYGYHILQLRRHYPIKEKEAVRDEFERKINRDVRSAISQKELIKTIKKDYKFKERPKRLKKLVEYADTNMLSGNWNPNEMKRRHARKWLFKLDGEKVTLKDYANFLMEKAPKLNAEDPQSMIESTYPKFRDDYVFNYEKNRLGEKYPDYQHLLREYKEGLLLFNVMDEKVWSKAVKDTAGLKAYYEANKKEYRWEERFDGYLIAVANADIADSVNRLLSEKGILTAIQNKDSLPDLEENMKAIKKQLNRYDATNVQYTKGKFEKGDHYAFRKVEKKPGIHQVERKEDGSHFVVLTTRMLPPGQKSFREVKGKLVSAYQDELEAQWLKDLKNEYEVEVNESVLEKMFKD